MYTRLLGFLQAFSLTFSLALTLEGKRFKLKKLILKSQKYQKDFRNNEANNNKNIQPLAYVSLTFLSRRTKRDQI